MPASTGGTHDYAQKWYDNSGDLIASLSTTTQSYVLPQGNSVGVQDYATLEIGSTLHPGLINILGNGSLAISNPSTNLNALLSVNSLSLSNALGVTSTFANDQIELYASDANPVGVFNVNTNGDISASGTLHVYGQATFDSGITLGGVSRTTWPSTSSSDWGRFGTTYGVSALMTSTTYPVWFDGALYASSSLIVSGNTTLLGSLSATLNTSSLRSIKLSSLTSAPDTSAGNLYFNSNDGKFYGYTSAGVAVDLGTVDNPADWGRFGTTYGVSALMTSTTYPVWFDGALYASSSLITSGNVTLGDSSSDIVYVSGKLGINSSTPAESLTVVGGNILQTASGNPTPKGSYSSSEASGVYVSGKYAYLADGANGLKIIDITNPAGPVLVGSIDTSGAVGVYVSGKYAYVADANPGGLKIIDVSDPGAPRLMSTYLPDGGGNISNVYVSGKYAYLADGMYGLRIVDISNPFKPILVGGDGGIATASDVYVSGKYAYVVGGTYILHIFDVSDPANPVQIDPGALSGAASYSIYVSGKYAYVANFTDGLSIVDISSSTNPVIMDSFATVASIFEVYVSGKYAYVGTINSGLQIVDISSSTNAVSVGFYNVGGASIIGVHISGKYAYTAYGANGLQIFDINGLETPALYAGNMQTNALTITESLDIGNNLYVRSGLNVGIGGIMTDGNLSINSTSTASYFGGSVGIGTTTPWATFDINHKLAIDSSGNVFASGTLGVFGNVGIGKIASTTAPIDTASGAYLSAGGSWTNSSNRNLKENFTEIDSADILNKINELVVSRWNYKAEASSTLHIGPVAQDFYSLFGLGDSTSISTIDPAGVSLLGIQELSKKLAELTSTTLDIKTTLNSQQILAPVDNSLQNYLVLNVESIRNLNNNWYIDNEGYFVTQLETSEGTKEMFGLQSPQAEFVFSSSSVLIDGEAEIIFETSEQEIIDPESSIKVTVTLTSGEASGIYVSEKSLTGFKVKELQGGTSNATFDWIVVAKRRTTDFVNTNNTDVVGDETVTTTENDNTEITTDTTTSTDNTTSTPEIPPAEEPVPTAEPEIVPPTEESVPTAEPEIVPPVEEPVLEPVVDNTPQVEEPMPVAESITEPAQ
ncbi:MAG: hypothetical protein US42_C0019G0003 [Candidatus Magasanikbacteria bacterium GW2011_GWC2_37_14]|uniref:Peptidase S74 domain-containing protein n=1 Tax=Candidatus Magasanikbacteria bacterium GW2011_GWC2_37_14 TaxID=1619046 RepID=A0A0G0G711_9BACT|nr:MAG: hypothetical protein US42_C0019G0003 [Candidatus Magasanikbacteria bacterium GW2011_GWC2_37_14]